MEMKKAVVFVGPPGSGKGTQAGELVRNHGFRHFDMGAFIREFIAREKDTNPFAAQVAEIVHGGTLLSDEMLAGVFDAMIKDAHAETRIIVDGIPRSTGQADMVMETLEQQGFGDSVYVFLDVPEDVSIQRLTLRGKTSGRKDDMLDAIPRRIEQYKARTAAVVPHLKEKGANVLWIDGNPSIEEVAREIHAKLGLTK